MATILLIGADESLLRTRAAVLRMTGCETVCATVGSALAQQTEHHCELVVLCHSLKDDAAAALTPIFQERWPQSPILQVMALRDWGVRPAAALVDGISDSQPERLIRAAEDLLRRWGARRSPESESSHTASLY